MKQIKTSIYTNVKAVAFVLLLSCSVIFGSAAPVYAGTTDGGTKPFTGTSYRVYDQSTSNVPGSPLAATNSTGVLSSVGAKFRVRMGITSPATNVVYVGEAREYGCALTADADVYCWGDNNSGTFGDGTVNNSFTPKRTNFGSSMNGETIKQLSVGYYHACAVTTVGSVYCWGWNSRGQVGNNSTAQINSPVKINGFGALAGKTVTQVSAGTETTCALASDKRVYCWGDNANSQAGYDRNVSLRTLVPVAANTTGAMSGKDIVEVGTNQYQTCAVDVNGIVYCWGSNFGGSLGINGPDAYFFQPQAVDMTGVLAGKTVKKLTVAQDYSCVIASDDLGYCWGFNSHGMLGDGTNTSPRIPVAIKTSGALAGKKLKQISANTSHTCALDTAGVAYCWGDNFEGALAINDSSQGENWSPTPIYTGGLLSGKTIKYLTAHYWSSCFVSTDDHLYCSGDNSTGELGDGTFDPSVQVVGGSRISYDVLSGSNSYNLQFAKLTAATCEAQSTGFSTVTNATEIAFAAIVGVTNGAGIATNGTDPSSAATTTPEAIYTGQGTIGSPVTSTSGFTSLWDYSLVDNGAAAGANYCIRMVYNGGVVLDAYTNVANVQIAGASAGGGGSGASTPAPAPGEPTLPNTGSPLQFTLFFGSMLLLSAFAVITYTRKYHYKLDR